MMTDFYDTEQKQQLAALLRIETEPGARQPRSAAILLAPRTHMSPAKTNKVASESLRNIIAGIRRHPLQTLRLHILAHRAHQELLTKDFTTWIKSLQEKHLYYHGIATRILVPLQKFLHEHYEGGPIFKALMQHGSWELIKSYYDAVTTASPTSKSQLILSALQYKRVDIATKLRNINSPFTTPAMTSSSGAMRGSFGYWHGQTAKSSAIRTEATP